MTGAIKMLSTEKFYQQLGIEHLRSRCWLVYKAMAFLQNTQEQITSVFI